MKILLANDDGIYAPGIAKLAEIAAKFGEVYVVAPDGQRSATSHSVSIMKEITVKEVLDFPVAVAGAYSISGMPADCVKVALKFLLEEKPDVVFSGINRGWNTGIDVAYSGTVAVAMEGVMRGIPSAAFSMWHEEDYTLVDAELSGIMEQLLYKSAGQGKMWNVNFPAGGAEKCKGILWDRAVAKKELFPDNYRVIKEDADGRTIMLDGRMREDFEEGTDLHALTNGYISVGTITNMVMGSAEQKGE